MAWISKDKPEGKRQAGQSEGTEMDNLESTAPREGNEEINAFVGKGVSFKLSLIHISEPTRPY